MTSATYRAVADALDEPATTSSPGAEQAAGRPCRAARTSLGPGVISGSFGPKIFPERAGLHVTA